MLAANNILNWMFDRMLLAEILVTTFPLLVPKPRDFFQVVHGIEADVFSFMTAAVELAGAQWFWRHDIITVLQSGRVRRIRLDHNLRLLLVTALHLTRLLNWITEPDRRSEMCIS